MNRQHAADTSLTIGAAYAKAMELLRAGLLNEARDVCLGIAAVRPEQPEVHSLLAAIAYQGRDHAQAIQHFQTSLKYDPDNRNTQLNLAKTYRDCNRWAEAAVAFAAIAERTPDDSAILYDLGKSYSELNRHAEAIEIYRRSLVGTSAPDVVQTQLAGELMKLGDLAEAESHYTAVLARTRRFPAALLNLATLRDGQGRMDEALKLLGEALACDPGFVDAHFHHALALMSCGRLEEGWAEYVWRFQRPGVTTLHDRFPIPYWNGEPLAGETLLIWSEQGPGDEILLATMIPEILDRGAQCTLVCTDRLVPLFQRSFPAIKILTRTAVKNDISAAGGNKYQASFSHLGLHLRPTLESFPQQTRYLKADPALSDELRHRYAKDAGERVVGIAWHSANPHASLQKSIPLAAWADVLRTPGFRFVSLQYGDHAAARQSLRDATGLELIVDETVNPMTDMDRFAAQVAAMDLVISVSNTTVHVAGALGRPVWTLVPASIGRIWYWFLDRTDSPWYNSMRLYRQERDLDWAPTFKAIVQDLSRLP